MTERLEQVCRYTVSGKVIYGKGIGKLVGMPTANLQVMPAGGPLPPVGVYIAKVLLGGQIYYGATNVGTHPTIDSDEEISIETHILNFNREIYDETIELCLYRRIRDIRKFDNFSLLLEQIRLDCLAVRSYFGVEELCSDLYMDIEKHRVCIGSREIFLSNKEFDVLYMLYSNPDAAFTKEQIYAAVWHEPPNGCLHAVENTVFQIRKKCRAHAGGKDYIKTVAGYGYKFR